MMQLCMLNKDNDTKLADRKIICYEYSPVYLKELKAEYRAVYDNIVLIVDDYKRNQGNIEIAGRNVPVKGSSDLAELTLKEYGLLITSDYFMEAYEKIEELLGSQDENIAIYFYPNKETKYDLDYRERFSGDLLKDIIIFRSGPHASSYVKGMDFADNARALFEYMLANGYNRKYRLVWLVKNSDDFHAYDEIPNVEFISFDWSVSENAKQRDLYYDALCHAKYLFFTDAYGFARNCRKDQVRVQLWHGCGFKTRVNFVRCEKRYEYTTVISDLYAKIHEDIYGLRKDQVLVTGYAKEDWLFHPIEQGKFYALGIPEADRYIFWLPTFRSTDEKLKQLNEYSLESDTGLPVVDTFEKLQELQNILQEMNIVLVVKLHPFQKAETVHCESFPNICLLDNGKLADCDIQINQLLGYADALISDYSSAAVDYLVLDRPIAFTLDDVEEYNNSRGFVFEDIKQWLPGKEIYDWEDYAQFVKDIGSGLDVECEKRRSIKKAMHRFSDDMSCRRILDELGICK